MGLLRNFNHPAALTDAELADRAVQDLSNLLNSKLGYSSFLPDFGVRDVSEFTNKEDIMQVYLEEIRRNIETWLPAIEVISIACEPEGALSRLHATIECRVGKGERELHMYTDIGSRKWRVSEN